MPTITDAELEQLERLAAEAQEGPWSMAWNDANTSVAVKSYRHYEFGRYVAAINWELQPADANYIAYANPERIGRLVAELRRYREGSIDPDKSLERIEPNELFPG